MPTTWGQIREEFSDLYRDSSTSFIGNAAGTGSEIYRMLRRVLRMIDAPEAYTFQESEYTLTLTGASRYDLDALIPGWKRIKSITTNTASNLSAYPISLRAVDIQDFQSLCDTYAYTIYQNRYLDLYNPSGNFISGALKIVYYTAYLVKDGSTNLYKALPTSDSDYFALPERFSDVVPEGLAMLAFRKDRSNRDDYRDAKAAFESRLVELRENHSITVDTPIQRMTASF